MNQDNFSTNIQKSHDQSWLKYGIWGIAIIIIGLAIWFFSGMVKSKTSPVPDGYKLSVEDHFAKNQSTWSTYYIYDNYILVTNDAPESNIKPVIYDGIPSSGFNLDVSDTTRTCDADSCYDYPKILNAIKKAIVGKASREYVGK